MSEKNLMSSVGFLFSFGKEELASKTTLAGRLLSVAMIELSLQTKALRSCSFVVKDRASPNN